MAYTAPPSQPNPEDETTVADPVRRLGVPNSVPEKYDLLANHEPTALRPRLASLQALAEYVSKSWRFWPDSNAISSWPLCQVFQMLRSKAFKEILIPTVATEAFSQVVADTMLGNRNYGPGVSRHYM